MSRRTNPAPDLPRFYSPQRVASMLDVTPRTIHRYVVSGEIAAIWIGTLVRIPATEVDRIIANVQAAG